MTNIYSILKKLDFFNKSFKTGKTDKDGNPEKLNYYDTMSFNDTEGLYPNMVLSVDGWDDFSELFSNRDLAEEVFSEDHSDFFSYYDTPMDEIVSDMTGKAMDSVIESIPAYTNKIMVGVNGGIKDSVVARDPVGFWIIGTSRNKGSITGIMAGNCMFCASLLSLQLAPRAAIPDPTIKIYRIIKIKNQGKTSKGINDLCPA